MVQHKYVLHICGIFYFIVIFTVVTTNSTMKTHTHILALVFLLGTLNVFSQCEDATLAIFEADVSGALTGEIVNITLQDLFPSDGIVYDQLIHQISWLPGKFAFVSATIGGTDLPGVFEPVLANFTGTTAQNWVLTVQALVDIPSTDAQLSATHVGTKSCGGFYDISAVNGVALPIKLLGFDVRKDGRNAILEWTTENETNNDYFTIEHSKDGLRFIEIAEISGAGNSTMIQRYWYTHRNLSEGLNYYRLKQTDFDGRFEYFDIKSVKIEPLETVRAYPNPTTDKFTVSHELPINVIIFNSYGELIYQTTEPQIEHEIDLGHFPSGMYYFTVEQSGYQIHQERCMRL